MDNSKDENTSSNVDSSSVPEETGRPSSLPRTPFTNLSQVDADLALARTLQDQERAYMMLRMIGGGSDHDSWETGSYIEEDDDEFDQHNSNGSDTDAHSDIGSGEDVGMDDHDGNYQVCPVCSTEVSTSSTSTAQ